MPCEHCCHVPAAWNCVSPELSPGACCVVLCAYAAQMSLLAVEVEAKQAQLQALLAEHAEPKTKERALDHLVASAGGAQISCSLSLADS